MREPVVVGNWKMHTTLAEARSLAEGIRNGCRGLAGVHVVLCPPFTALAAVSEVLAGSGILLGAQDCHWATHGAYTGAVSPVQVADAGARVVILGHSERRQLYGETDALIARKLAVAMETGLTPVLCIGEDLRVRDSGGAAVHLAEQVHAVASAVTSGPIVVAYEPIWAIGTGRNASGALCAETVGEVRSAISRFWSRSDVAVLYGGSVTPENVEDLVTNGAIDGFLVGGASLDSSKFLAIYTALVRT